MRYYLESLTESILDAETAWWESDDEDNDRTWFNLCQAIEMAICEQNGIPFTNKPGDPSDGQRLYQDDKKTWVLETP